MRVIKLLAKIVFGLIIVIAIGGYLFVRNFDLNQYKPYAVDYVKNELGRTLVLNGDAHLGISLSPTVIINDVELSNPQWAKNKKMLKVKQLEVKVALLPLLKKKIEIDKVVLDGAQVYLETAADGRQSWDFKGKTPQETLKKAAQDTVQNKPEILPAKAADIKANPEMAFLAGFAARNVLIEQSSVEYFDAKSNKENNLVINKLTLSVPGTDEEIEANFDVIADGNKVKGELTAGSIENLLDESQSYPFDLTVKAMGIDLALKGSAANLTSSLRYAVNANIYNPAGNLKAPETTLKALVKGDLKQASADIEALNIVNNLITGKADINWSGKIPSLNAVLNSAKINLQNFSQNSNFALKMPLLIAEAQALPVPNEAIPYQYLRKANAKADLKIKQLIISPGMQADDVSLKATLQNGVLNVNPLKLDFGGGQIDAGLTVNAGAQTVQLKLSSKDMLLQNLHKEFKSSGKNNFGVLSGGNIDLYVDLNGSGLTYNQLIQNLKGSAIAIVGKSVIQTGSLNFITGNFITQLLTALRIDTSKTRQIDLNCAVVRSDISGGKAVFPKGIAVSSEQLSLVSDGNINLVNDKLDFTLKPFSGKVVDTNVVQAISSLLKIKGTLENPKVTLDDKEALKTVIGIAATGGTTYLGSKVLLDADSSPCYTALVGTPYASRFPKPSGVQAAGQDVYKGAVEGVDKSLKGLKDAAKDILGAFKVKK